MQIGSVASQFSHISTLQSSQPERAERGPDNDHDGDDGSAATRKAASSTPPSGSGNLVDIKA